ncbi:winged helix-turn-helix domain-containing protein [Providencia sp. PROV129]|uniref:winged helix-turn-helix domain-containing protein n=1 Tax=Providencia sp. PROV129 TaxID=2949839 RepID=UPI00234A4095|nr:helix-turn-helix domain-containing protein [Providencia sp. PROV129]
MNYLINNYVIYDSVKGELYTRNDGEVVKLSKTLNRLMLVFVQNNNQILDKERLLLDVWQGHNQVVSDNNLNSNISVLRRYLSSFFDDNIIISIPKIGFKLSADVILEDVKSELKNSINIENKLIKNKLFWLFLILFFISLIIILFVEKNNNYANYPIIGKIDKCTIHYINDDYKIDIKKVSMKELQNKITDLDINCNSSANIYYYVSSISIRDNDKGILFLSYCPEVLKDKPAMSCETFYEK